MSDQTDISLSNWNKRGAVEEIENLKAIRANAWDEHTHTYRWLMASLLGVNGAACLAVVGHEAIPISHRLFACGAFVVGLVFALMVAVFGQRSIQKSLAPLQKLIGYWMTVADDGQRDDRLEEQLNEELRVSARIGFGSRVTGWISGLAFVVGIIISGKGLTTANEVETCRALTSPTVIQSGNP